MSRQEPSLTRQFSARQLLALHSALRRLVGVDAAGIDGLAQGRDLRVGALDVIDADGRVLFDGMEQNFSAHELAAGELAILEGNGEVDIIVGEGVAFGQVLFGVDTADKGVKVFDFFFGGHALL